MDSASTGTQASPLAAWRPISCAVFGSSLLHWLPSGASVHKHSCGLFCWYDSSMCPLSCNWRFGREQQGLHVTSFAVQVGGPSMLPGFMGHCVWPPSL